MTRRLLIGANQPLISVARKCTKTASPGLDMEHARTEIERLKLELAQAREELENLTEATSDFVRLML
jgi:hypothetical protein